MSKMAIAVLISACALSACGLGSPTLITHDGALAPCESPHCVSSLSADPDRFVEPIHYSGTRDSARAALLRVIGATPGAAVVTQTQDYIHVEYTSSLVHYIDDVELLFPAQGKVVQVRSSSRIGYYDFGVNRKRVEALRASFEALQP